MADLRSLRRRFTGTVGLRVAVWYAAVFIFTATVVGLLAYRLLATSLERRDRDALLVKLAEYAGHYERGGPDEVSQFVGVERASGSQDSVMVRLVGPGADVLFFSGPPAWNVFDVGSLRISRSASGDDWVLVPSSRDATTTLEVVSRVLFDGTVIQVGRTTVEREQFLAQVRDLFGVILITVVATGLVGGVALTRSALRPLRELRDTVIGIARTGRLDTRVAAERHGDLVDELNNVFNAMLARIETLVAGMRDSLDNVAHDLRTPIARLRARVESALGTETSPAVRESLAECLEEADRVMALLTSLMDISEAEAGTMKLTVTSVPAEDLANDAIALYEDIADDRGVTLSSTVPAGLAVKGDRQRLQQVMANLVDNAVKYTSSGGSVTIGAAPAESGMVAVTVLDTGQGIAGEDLPRIWDRLYRGDTTHEHSLGLGLSLVKAIVAAHGGRVDVESHVGAGSRFRVILPAA